jgi:DNA-binding transcriptional LysR family regulator
MRGVTLRQLRAFALVARHRSFVRAAAELHLTPSAVSLQIKELEQAVGLPLFGRSGKAVSVTRVGELLLVDVYRALGALKDADDTLARLRGRETGVISIGMVSNAKYIVPRILARFHAAHPGVELRLSVGNREQLVRQLASSEVDLVIMGTPPGELDTRAEAFAPHPLGIIAAPEHPLARLRGIAPEALKDHEFIVRETGSGTRAAMERYFRSWHIEPARLMEMTSNETIKQAVIANMGLAFLSLHTVGLELQAGLLVATDVAGLPLVRRWYVVNLGAEPLTDAADSLRRFIIEHGGALVTEQFAGVDLGELAAAPEATPPVDEGGDGD